MTRASARKAVDSDNSGSSRRPISQPISWSQIITSFELSGKASLTDLLESFRRGRERPAVADATSHQEGQQPTKHVPVATRRVVAPQPERGKLKGIGQTVSALSGLKRKRDYADDDDLLYHIRKPDPPTWTLLDDFETVETLSAEVKQASLQAASYALETLACTAGTRLFCVNVLLKNDRIYLWYYDACGFVYTESISLIEDFEKAAALLVGMACCSPAQLGALPDVIEPPLCAKYSDHWPPEDLKGHTLAIPRSPGNPENLLVTLQDHVFAQYVLAGRRTFVYTIKTKPALSNDELMVKFSYQICIRREEHEFIDLARKAGVDHLPTVHTWGDLWNMSDGVRSIFYEKDGVEFEDRMLRAIVYNRYLPLDALLPDSPESIPLMAYQLMDCK